MAEQGPVQDSSTEIEIEVRPIQNDEFLSCISRCRVNGLHCVHRLNIVGSFRRNPREIIAAFYKGKMVGTCWDISSVQGRRIIGGLTIDPGYPQALMQMITYIRESYHPNIAFDVNIPVSMGSTFQELGWKRHWDIHLYTAVISDIKLLPLENEHSYLITSTINHNPLFSLAIERSIPQITSEIQNIIQAINLGYIIYEDDEESIGWANLKKARDSPWIIGPVLAIDDDIGKHLLRRMFTYLLANFRNGFVVTYILADHVTYSNFLRESGFRKTPYEWTRYSINETTYLTDISTYDEVRSIMRSIECMRYCCP